MALLLTGAPSGVIGQAPRRVLRITPTIRIDGNQADLSSVTFVGTSANDRILIGQRDDNLVRVFDRTGKALGSFGRGGEGPGEFRYLMRGGWLADSLWMFDNALRRVTVAGPQLKIARTIHVPTDLSVPPGPIFSGASVSGATVIGLAPGGALLLLGIGLDAGKKFASVIVRMDSLGGVGRSVALVNRQGGVSCAATASGRRFDLSPEYCFWGSYAVAPDGGSVVTVSAPVNGAAEEAFRLVAVSGFGDTVIDRTVHVPRLPIDRKRYEDMVDTGFAHFPNNSLPLEAALRMQIHVPEYFPSASRVLIGSDGTIWVRRRALTTQWWLGFDALGRYVGEFAFPLSGRPVAFGRSSIYAVETGDDGLESVVGYRIRQ